MLGLLTGSGVRRLHLADVEATEDRPMCVNLQSDDMDAAEV